ncbi:acyl-CoA thioester hydrolase/BAAT C-terminal domain-containing protein [Alteromonas ponticola]|uniref:Dienelactone hydrolase n=1 Tax=Alteromonas ponticola TaxID=2720613 RepID=A0ABX1R0X5_9ALTE|nr:acyl-CoA thioester hydrolase/BAAT C-terminal domain-containing protein [Alteromonas ponticola]NMH60123.1 dienelactone hydrolase [Alteromonas ponticola]
MLSRLILLLSVFTFLISSPSLANPQKLTMAENGIAAEFYPARSTQSTLAVLVLGGSEGSIPLKLARAVADLGHATLALAYFNHEGLPAELNEIPLEYVDKAKAWLMDNSKVERSGLVIVGWSKGAELALLMASRDSHIKRVVAVAPSSVVWAGILTDWSKIPSSSWTYQGKPLVHVSFRPSGPVSGLLDLYTQSLQNRTDNGKASIDVQKITGKVILLTGGNDEIWPSSQMADDVCNSMNSANNGQCEHHTFAGRDHLLDLKFLDRSTPMHQLFADSISDIQ